MKKQQYIYLILDSIDRTYKIGISTQPGRRLKALQTGNAHRLVIEHIHPTKYGERLESMLHACYREVRLEGEWFALDIAMQLDYEKRCWLLEEFLDLKIKDPLDDF